MSFILNKKTLVNFLWPGSYELRLYNCDENSGGFVLARETFKVIDPKSVFPPEEGKPGVRRPTDLELPGMARGLRAGEYLGLDTCNYSLLKPYVEPMELRFVKWVEEKRKYVPITGAVDFGESVYLEGKLENEASQNFYIAEIRSPSGGLQEVTLVPDQDDPTVIRSEMLYLIWEPSGAGE